jgi:hypothetical protein
MQTNSNFFPDQLGYADTAGYSLTAAGDLAASPSNQETSIAAVFRFFLSIFPDLSTVLSTPREQTIFLVSSHKK